MRFPAVTLAAAAWLSAAALPVSAALSRQAKSYFEVRDRSAQVVQGPLPLDLFGQPDRYAGRLIEVRGAISGITESSGQTVLSVGVEGSPGAIVVVTPEARAKYQGMFEIHSAIRALCKVVTLNGGGALELVIPVREREAGEAEVERAAAARQQAVEKAVTTRAQRGPRTLASRRMGRRTAAGPAADGYTAEQTLELYSSAIRYFNRRLSVPESNKIAAILLNYAITYGLDARLVMAVIAVESNFKAHAVSPVGAQGLGQLMPGTASELGVWNPFDHNQNIAGSTRLLSQLKAQMRAKTLTEAEAIKLALACYNAGAGAVKKFKGIPPYRETQAYVKKVMRLYYQLAPERDPSRAQ
ncbi:MAG: lytic transglycosylase domain-containing protein [Armatimonadetes bacterium]|nr:lytic transglycosylase domain-containing protein [Armatimonadota bacterium]